MATVTFNTLTFAKRLKKQGMSEELAEEVANGLAESRELDLTNLVTKDYLDMKLKAELATLEKRLLIWMIGIGFGGFSVVISVMVALFKFYLGKNIGA